MNRRGFLGTLAALVAAVKLKVKAGPTKPAAEVLVAQYTETFAEPPIVGMAQLRDGILYFNDKKINPSLLYYNSHITGKPSGRMPDLPIDTEVEMMPNKKPVSRPTDGPSRYP